MGVTEFDVNVLQWWMYSSKFNSYESTLVGKKTELFFLVLRQILSIVQCADRQISWTWYSDWAIVIKSHPMCHGKKIVTERFSVRYELCWRTSFYKWEKVWELWSTGRRWKKSWALSIQYRETQPDGSSLIDEIKAGLTSTNKETNDEIGRGVAR